jgi:hypothetical protein
MADTPTKTTEERPASVEVPRQDQPSHDQVKAAQKQAETTGGHDAEIKARTLSAEETRQQALKDDEAKGLINGIPKDEFNGMTLGKQRRAELNNPYSNLRNRITLQDEVDFQILSNTNAYTIQAMTGVELPQLIERAKELDAPLKDTAAGNGGPGTGIG